MVPFHVPIELTLEKKERTTQVALKVGRMVVDEMSVGERVMTDGTQWALRGRIERQQGAPTG